MPSIAQLDMPAALRHLRRVDGPMNALIDAHGAPDFSRTRNSFASLGRAIIYQQLNGKAAGSIYKRFLALFPRAAFPKPEVLAQVPSDQLRSVGVSRAKASYLLDLAEKYRDGMITPRRFSRMDNDELLAHLTVVKGIGPWSVHMFLMFGLCRPNVLPVGDLGVQRGVQMYFDLDDLPKPAVMESVCQPWQPYRSVASWYMWRLIENGIPRKNQPDGNPARSDTSTIPKSRG